VHTVGHGSVRCYRRYPRIDIEGEAIFSLNARASAAGPERKTPRKAGFSKNGCWVNCDAAWTEYPRQGVVELVAGAP